VIQQGATYDRFFGSVVYNKLINSHMNHKSW
jgi:hypothetical protein